MNRFKKYLLMFGLILATVFFSPMISNGQPPPDPGCDPLNPACPIDGGLSLLIAAGISIGAKKAYELKKKQAKDFI